MREARASPRAPQQAPEIWRERNIKATHCLHPSSGVTTGRRKEARARGGRMLSGAYERQAKGPGPHPVDGEGPGAPCTCFYLRGGRSGDQSIGHREWTRGGDERASAPAGPEGKGQAAPSDPARPPPAPNPPLRVPGRTPPTAPPPGL